MPALFLDIGPRTPKVRLDYKDVMVALEEESYFEPLFQWHYQRGMLYGCDHGGRGGDVTEFGDYFRTQRWMLGPGNDQPNLGTTITRTKVQSSISHLYKRPRTWLEGYYGSGWGTTLEGLTRASSENYAFGSTLQALHGLYYTTHGGYWEWAPPCNHFRMPYWEHMGTWSTWSQRLCYVLSQGVHRCDVAIIYPVTPGQSGLDPKISRDAAFGVANHLFNNGIDFDFMDDDSLARAEVQDKELRVSGEAYRVLVLPSLTTVRWSTLEKAARFKRAGGIVLAVGGVPEASDRIGRNDPKLDALVKELFPTPVADPKMVEQCVNRAFPRDFGGTAHVNHRKIGVRDVYWVVGAEKDSDCFFRATGKVELWDPWTGTARPLPVIEQTKEGTKLAMPLSKAEGNLIVFSPGEPLKGAQVAQKSGTAIEIAGDWEFELKPTMDNRWGDFHWPPTPTIIGAEVRQLRYADETAPNPGWEDPNFNDAPWPNVTVSYGPRFWKLGPLPNTAETAAVEARLIAMKQVDPGTPVEIAGRKYQWRPYAYSWRWGLEGDPGHQGYHGLKENISDGFICLGAPKKGKNETVYTAEADGTRYYLWSAAVAKTSTQANVCTTGNSPAAVWVNHSQCAGTISLNAGANPVLLRYDKPGRGAFVLDSGAVAPPVVEASGGKPVFKLSILTMTWYDRSGILPFDPRPEVAHPAGWYRFLSPPGLRAMKIASSGKVRAWAGGKELVATAAGTGKWLVTINEPSPRPLPVAVRIEQERANYGGAAITEPITLDCVPGTIATGDWSRIGGLACYSGGAWYRKTIALTAGQASGAVTLDLGSVVATAEVRINGKTAGIRVASPWTFDIGPLMKAGENRVEILVYNTLANHYATIPSNYRGNPVSGILGPVRMILREVR